MLRRKPVTTSVRSALVAVVAVTLTGMLAPDSNRAASADPGGPGAVSQPATGAVQARRVEQPADVISVSAYTVLSQAIIDRAEQMALALNIPAARGRGFSAGLVAVRRGDAVIQLASGPGGRWQFPMSTTALPIDAIGALMGHAVSSTIAEGFVVMSATSAGLRGAAVGDQIDLVANDGSLRQFTIGMIAADDVVGGTEIVMSIDEADVLGATLVTRVLLYGQFQRSIVENSLAAYGLVDSQGVRVSRSWSPRSPDSVIGLARTKALLGEFAFRIDSNDSLTLDPAWVAANVEHRAFASISVRAYCHRVIIDDIQAALTEVAAAGLASGIDLRNTNTSGGCWNPRYVRAASMLGSVSRHAWAQALDMNTDTNAQGAVPKMNCDIVRIFRKHHFAWGGNFTLSDGMHFEWVGEQRDTIQYPSRYCPNLATAGPSASMSPTAGVNASSPGRPPETARATMFADDGWTVTDSSGD